MLNLHFITSPHIKRIKFMFLNFMVFLKMIYQAILSLLHPDEYKQ